MPCREAYAYKESATLKLAAFIVLPVVILSPTLATARVEHYALLIGSNRGAKDDNDLHYAESDALRVYEVLRDLGGYQPANMALLRGENADTVRSTLIAFNDRVREATSLPNTDVVLFVYYSGHADADRLRMANSALPIIELVQLVRGSAAEFRLVVLDACRSGTLTRLKGARVRSPFVLPNEHNAGEGVAFLTATAPNEDAQESDALRGSFFTHAFVSGLLGAADRDHDGRVVLDEAYRYAYHATLRATSRTLAGTQHASFRYDFSGRGDVVLTELETYGQERATLSFPERGEFLLMRNSDTGPIVAELGSHAENRRLSVRPGRYFVRMREPDVMYEGTLQVSAGSTQTIKTDDLNRIEYARLARKGLAPTLVTHGIESGVGVRTALPNEGNPCIGGFVGYTVDFEYFGLAARFDACTSSWRRADLSSTNDNYDISARIYRAWDWSWFVLDIGIEMGAALFHQHYESPGEAPSRVSFSPFVGPRLSVGLDLGVGFFIAFDVSVATYFLRTKAPREAATIAPNVAICSSFAFGKRF